MENINETPEAKENEEQPEKKASLVQDILEIAESTIITVFIIVLIFTYILHPVNIVGHSMVPTLNKNYDWSMENTDKIFMSTVYFKVSYGDILVIDKDVNYLIDENGEAFIPVDSATSSLNECIIKRVIAVGGQTIDIRRGEVYVDGAKLDEPYINEYASTSSSGTFEDMYPITIPEGYYFVMGDNRNHSTDSRSRTVGLIKKDQIYGKALIKYYPFNEFDILTDSWKG